MKTDRLIKRLNICPPTEKYPMGRPRGWIYDPEGCCPTIETCGGGWVEPKIIVYE